jgi:hypothetical protein
MSSRLTHCLTTTAFRNLLRLEVRVAFALTKPRPVMLIAHNDACQRQETVVAVPIRTMPPPFQCHGLIAVSSLLERSDLTGFIRCDLPVFYRRADIGPRVIHRFTNPNDVATIDRAIRDALGL